MIRIEVVVEINRSSDELFTYVANFENNPKWQAGQISATFTSEGPLHVGSTYDQVAKFLGRTIVSQFKVIEYEPGYRIKATSTGGSFPITFERIVESIGDGAEVTAIVEGDSSGFFKLAEPIMGRMVKRSVESDYRNLKRIMEQE